MDDLPCATRHDYQYLLHTPRGLNGHRQTRNSRWVGSQIELDRLAARQHGVFSVSQARELGLTRGQINYRLETGRWVRIAEGVYALASAGVSWEGRLQASLLSNPGAIVGGRSAGVLHRFPDFRRGKPEILTSFSSDSRSRVARVIRSRHFDKVETTTARGFPVSTIAETILTLSLTESPVTIERIVDDQLVSGRLDVAEFNPILERLEFARQPGLGALARIVRSRGHTGYQPPTTELERLLYRLLDRPEVPGHERQLPLSFPTIRATVDAFIPTWRMIVEADGRRWHTRRADFERDRARDNSAAAEGFIVVRFTYTMLKDNPDACLETLLKTGSWRKTG